MRKAAREEALIPAGMRILPESERLEMLETLQKSSQDVERQLATLPFHLETPSQVATALPLLWPCSPVAAAPYTLLLLFLQSQSD